MSEPKLSFQKENSLENPDRLFETVVLISMHSLAFDLHTGRTQLLEQVLVHAMDAHL